jgi:hypothetical protein
VEDHATDFEVFVPEGFDDKWCHGGTDFEAAVVFDFRVEFLDFHDVKESFKGEIEVDDIGHGFKFPLIDILDDHVTSFDQIGFNPGGFDSPVGEG